MKFGPVPVSDAMGAILAHSLPALRLRKGRMLEAGDIAAMQAAGMAQVTVAQLEGDDLDENTAAQMLADALVVDQTRQGLRASAASTGRVNIIADRPGLVMLNAQVIHAANAIDPMITLATLPPLHRVEAGDMVATIKIISYGVAAASVDLAATVLAPRQPQWSKPPILSIRPAIVQRAALIETHHPGQTPNPKGREALQQRLARLGVTLTQTLDVAHEEAAIAEALTVAGVHVVFLLTASATCDIRDTGPAGVRRAGGEITHFGMPVDPGNLLFLAKHKGRPVIGLPGCARSPALNGADWVLERVCCGLDVTGEDITQMGVGGLLKEIPNRPHPRRTT